jgi:hypothetical protein
VVRFKLPIRYLRWVFACLYILILLAQGIFSLVQGGRQVRLIFVVYLAVMIVTQLLFLLGAGTIELCRPIRKRRLLLPILIASGMMALLVAGCSAAMMELFKVQNLPAFGWLWVALIWLFWAIVFFVHCRKLERWQVLKRLTLTVLAGSLVDLLASVPAHLVVSRRPGCFVGMFTAMGVTAGICAMLWAFGPGIVLLFFRERRQIEKRRNEATPELKSPKEGG